MCPHSRTAGAGRDLWGSPSPPLPWTEQSRRALNTGREGEPTTPPQPAPGLCHPQSQSVFPHIQLETPVFQFVPPVPCKSEFPGRTIPAAGAEELHEDTQDSRTAPCGSSSNSHQAAPTASQGFGDSSVKFILKNINLFFHLRTR